MEKLKKMKYLLLSPFWGNIIIMLYLNVKSHKITYIKHKHWFLVGLITGIIFWAVFFLVFVCVGPITKKFIDPITFTIESAFNVTCVIAFFVANYLSYIPCLLYVNYLIKQDEEEKNRDNNNASSENSLS